MSEGILYQFYFRKHMAEPTMLLDSSKNLTRRIEAKDSGFVSSSDFLRDFVTSCDIPQKFVCGALVKKRYCCRFFMSAV